MESKFVTKKYLKDFIFHFNGGTESLMFYNDDVFLKILKKDFLTKDRKEIINRLDEFKNDNILTPLFLLHDRTGIIGYATHNCLDYSFIDELLTNSLFDTNIEEFKKRKDLMIKLSKTLDFLYNKEFAYYDIHYKNILLKDNNIKLIDLDGGLFRGYNNHEVTYPVAIKFSYHRLLLFTLSYIYNMDYRKFDNYFSPKNIPYQKIRTLLDYLPHDLEVLFNIIYSDEYTINTNITNSLYELDENTYLDTINILKRTN